MAIMKTIKFFLFLSFGCLNSFDQGIIQLTLLTLSRADIREPGAVVL